MAEALAINVVRKGELSHYEPYGWQHWPDFPWLSYQFRRALGETQEGGGSVSELFLAASRMVPGDLDSWHENLLEVSNNNMRRGDAEEASGHIRTAMNCWLRAADMYRSAEFWLTHDDLRRLATFTKCEQATHKFLQYCVPKGEVVEIPYEGKSLYAYFIRAPYHTPKQPVLIAFGGLDSFKDELWFMVGRGALQRGISVLMVDGPGQGGTLRRHGIPTRFDYEVPVGACIDWLGTRSDVDLGRIAVSGSSLGGYYAARAGAKEPRLAAAIAHGAQWDIGTRMLERDDNHMLASHLRWVFGGKTMKEVWEISKPFKLEGALDSMRCPFLICHGGHDVLGVQTANIVYEYAKKVGVDATLRFVTESETGADHCQHDNPTIGQEIMLDWLADKFGIDQTKLGNDRPL
jgi:pimeloyl-ACP methyl ester carboxylesterase